MKIFETTGAIKAYRKSLEKTAGIIGLVPTMGALHQGHLSLIEAAKKECDVVVVSIFINPTQFNDPVDLKNYPRTTREDTKLLAEIGTDVLFMPGVHDIYPHPDSRVFNFGQLEKVMEGKYRPGHFNGVAQVVSILFDIIKPHKAYFGQKDFQQLTIIKELVRQLDLDIEIVSCPIIREKSGLAMSSRNRRLDEKSMDDAAIIYKTLRSVIEKKDEKSPAELARWGAEIIDSHPAIELEYFRIVNTGNLQPAKKWGGSGEQVACVAVKINNVRLIDNMIFP
ncbi:MAG: pantoate--beta-alanine ligase [Bacteroidota bacterium]